MKFWNFFQQVGMKSDAKKDVGIFRELLDKVMKIRYNELIIGEYGFLFEKSEKSKSSHIRYGGCLWTKTQRSEARRSARCSMQVPLSRSVPTYAAPCPRMRMMVWFAVMDPSAESWSLLLRRIWTDKRGVSLWVNFVSAIISKLIITSQVLKYLYTIIMRYKEVYYKTFFFI